MAIKEKETAWVQMVLHSSAAFRARTNAQDIIDKAHSEDKWDTMLEIQAILENVVVEAYTEGYEIGVRTVEQKIFELKCEMITAQDARDMDIQEVNDK